MEMNPIPLTGKYFCFGFNKGTVEKTSSGAFQFYKHLMNMYENEASNWLAYAPYDLIGLASELTEEEAAVICEGKEESVTGYWYKDYEKENSFRFAHAKNSLASLLKSKSLKPEITLIIKKA